MADSFLKTSLVSSTLWRIIYGHDDNRKNYKQNLSTNNVLKLSGGCGLRSERNSDYPGGKEVFKFYFNSRTFRSDFCRTIYQVRSFVDFQSKQVKLNFKIFCDDKFIFKSTLFWDKVRSEITILSWKLETNEKALRLASYVTLSEIIAGILLVSARGARS